MKAIAFAVACLLLPACGGRIASSEWSDDAGAPRACGFDKDYFYCHLEPQYLLPYCGPHCHFDGAAVSGMVLLDHAPVDCGGDGHPLDPSAVGMGSPAESNFESVSLEMPKAGSSCDYRTWPIYTRPAGSGHPQVINPSDPNVSMLLSGWVGR